MTEREVDEVLERANSAANRPAKLHSPGTGGSKPKVSTEEARHRRQMMSSALAQGFPTDAIYTQFNHEFGLSEEQTRRLMREVRAQWEAEDSEEARYAAAKQRRRLWDHIREARKAGKWAAVANLEKVLASVEGTDQPTETALAGDGARLSDAILAILGQTKEGDVRIMIERQILHITGADPRVLAKTSTVIDAEGEEV